MSGGGMGFIFDPAVKPAAQDCMQEIMARTKRELEAALPFAMEPVVYDFAINERGTWAELLDTETAGDERGHGECRRVAASPRHRVSSPAHAARLLRLDRPGAAAAGSAAASPGAPR